MLDFGLCGVACVTGWCAVSVLRGFGGLALSFGFCGVVGWVSMFC